MSTFTADKDELVKRWFDFQFTGEPIQCGDACDELKRDFAWSKSVSLEDQVQYKYMIDVDGNGWSGRFHRLMLSNSAVLKATIFPEWYADHVQPWLQSVLSSLRCR